MSGAGGELLRFFDVFFCSGRMSPFIGFSSFLGHIFCYGVSIAGVCFLCGVEVQKFQDPLCRGAHCTDLLGGSSLCRVTTFSLLDCNISSFAFMSVYFGSHVRTPFFPPKNRIKQMRGT